VWFIFAAQSWALWNIRNKLTIEGKLINKRCYASNDDFYVAIAGVDEETG
jgi:hypothetical protein